MSARRPNIVLLMADQLAASFLPDHGQPVVQAPHLTALARSGTAFESAYCASPLCAPSRSAMLAGRRASAIGVFDNAAELPAETPTIAHLLRASGYHTVLAGKMHFVGPDQLHGFEERLTTDVYPAGFDWTPDWRLATGERLSWYHNLSGILDAGVREAATQTDYDDEVCFRAVQRIGELARRPDRQPFFLVVSFTNPHDPWEVRARHWDMYADGSIDSPLVPGIPRGEADPHSARLRDMCGLDERPLSQAEILRGRHGYYAAISYMDERVGEVLDALSRTGLRDDTVVAFTADHGEMGGERGLWFKMSFFEGSARVPLIVAGPGVAAGRVSEPVSHLDLAPTLAEMAGAGAQDAEFEGRSLTAALRSGSIAPATVVSEYLAEGVTAPAVMLRRGAHKYIRCPGDPDQLFDLRADPRELRNLAADPAQARACADLRAQTEARWDLAGLRDRVLRSQAARRLVSAALATGAHMPWDHEPRFDASRQYVRGPAAGHPRPGAPLVPGTLPEEPEQAPPD
ncbi:MAG TPA: choline-sulfatase [Gaiellales bacterium]